MPSSTGPETDIFAPYDPGSSRDSPYGNERRAPGDPPAPYDPWARYAPRTGRGSQSVYEPDDEPAYESAYQSSYDRSSAYDLRVPYDVQPGYDPRPALDPEIPDGPGSPGSPVRPGSGGEPAASRPHRAHAVDRAPAIKGAAGAKGVLLPVGIVLVICTIFVSVYLAAFHAPDPHRLPVAVVGSSQTLSQVERGLDKGLPGGFSVRGYATEAEARHALAERQVYAAYVVTGKASTLLYAGANGTGVTATVTGAFGAVAKAGGQHLTARDTVPSAAGDSRGLSVFYAAFGVVLAGFLYGTMTYQLAPTLEYRLRMISLGTFGVLGGLVVALVAGRGFDALPGSFLGVAGVIALMATAASGATMVLLRLFGPAGVSMATITLLILGNASGGGILPAAYLPGWLHPLHAILPVGVGIRAIQGLSYFDSDGVELGVTILGVWTAVCAIVLYVRDVWSVRLLARTP